MTIMQTVASTWDSAKPTIIGLAMGLLLGPLISNLLGWQVTSNAARIQRQVAVADARALVCAALARAEIADPTQLAWSARNELARKWAVMPGGTLPDADVIASCTSKLASAPTRT